MVFNAKILGERRGVVATVLARNCGGQGDADDLVCPEGFGGEGGDDCGVNAATQADDGLLEAALVSIIAQAEYERVLRRGVALRIEVFGDVSDWIVKVDDVVLSCLLYTSDAADE